MTALSCLVETQPVIFLQDSPRLHDSHQICFPFFAERRFPVSLDRYQFVLFSPIMHGASRRLFKSRRQLRFLSKETRIIFTRVRIQSLEFKIASCQSSWDRPCPIHGRGLQLARCTWPIQVVHAGTLTPEAWQAWPMCAEPDTTFFGVV